MQRLKPLTGIRAVAALLVLAFHADFLHGYQGAKQFHVPGLRFGWIGVDLFFVLSGFLMATVCKDKLSSFDPRRAWAFLRDRFLRIAPAYYLSIPIILLAFGNIDFLWHRPGLIFEHLGYGQSFDLEHHGDISAIYWTLSIEAQFYLLLPLLLPLFSRRPGAFVVGSLVLSLACRAWWFGSYAGVVSLPVFMGHFALGMAAATWSKQEARPWTRHPDAWVVGGLLVVAVPLLTLIPAGSPWQAWESVQANVWVRPLAAAGFVAVLLGTLQPRSVVGRMLGLRPLQWLGERSYAIYLMHIAVFVPLTLAFGTAITWPVYLVVGTAGSLLAAYTLHGLVEQPVLRLRHRLRVKDAQPVVQPTPASAARRAPRPAQAQPLYTE